MDEDHSNLPQRVEPYVVQEAVNEAIPLCRGTFTLQVGVKEVALDNCELRFELSGQKGLVFAGKVSGQELPRLVGNEGTLRGECDGEPFAFSVYVLHQPLIHGLPGEVGGILAGGFWAGPDDCDVLRFCLGNFPRTMGRWVAHAEERGHFAGRMVLPMPDGECHVDWIPEVSKLAGQAKEEQGSVITHVGHWKPRAGPLTHARPTKFLNYCVCGSRSCGVLGRGHCWPRDLLGARSQGASSPTGGSFLLVFPWFRGFREMHPSTAQGRSRDSLKSAATQFGQRP